MDISAVASRLGLAGSKSLIRKAEELRRFSDVQFDSSIIGVVRPCLSPRLMLPLPSSTLSYSSFDRGRSPKPSFAWSWRHRGTPMSGMSEKAYMRSLNAMKNGIGVKQSLDVRQLGIQFGCVRLISFVKKGLSLYKDRFLAALPPSRRTSTDFNRPVFTAVAFYLCAKRHKVSTSMGDLCFDVFGISKEKKNPKAVKGHRDDGDASDDSSGDEVGLCPHVCNLSQIFISLIFSVAAPLKAKKQATLKFTRKSPSSIALEAL
ncbi:hypothetical protein B296_00001985 [Ensete ventricosum]|uniref:ORC6 second cyclin-like domain-containing protein n=1 Tax=Ensete ventricosum TaxID=4639 RepID=A0A427A4W0_ENSVE|nr:hypothetical protein B296_00001985 [Ensete ventricosum]